MLVRRGIRARDRLVMRDEQHRHAVGDEPLEELEHRRRVVRVQVARRLVAQQQARLADQRAGDRDALLLAARQLARHEVGAMGDADALERRQRALAATGALAAAVDLRQHHVLEHACDGRAG